MPTPIGDAYVEVRADTRQVARDVETGVTKSTKEATKGMGGLEKSVQNVGNAAKLYIGNLALNALVGVKRFADESVESYSNLNESQNATVVAFGDSADEVAKLGRSAATNLGLSNAEFNSLSVSVSAFVDKIAAGLGQDVPGTLDTLTTRIADFSSVMNLDVAEGFETFRSGLAGESEPLRKFGIDVSAATVENVALAAGLVEVGEEMTEAEKVTARYLTIMEQTEKVTGDFANTAEDFANKMRTTTATTENQRAALGELLADPTLTASTSIWGGIGQVIADVVTEVKMWQGEMTEAEAAISEFEISTGIYVDTAEAAVLVAQDYTTSLGDIISAANLSAEELQKLRTADEDLLEELGLTSDEVQALSGILEEELVASMNASRDAARHAKGATDELSDATGNLGDEALTAAELLGEEHDAIRAMTDPMFALRDATQEEADAQAAVNQAIADFGAGSAEHLDAVADLSQAAYDLKYAQDEAAIATTQTLDDFVNQQIELGLTREQALLLVDEFERLQGFKFTPKTIEVSYSSPRAIYRHDGGPVEAGMPYIVKPDEEVFIPRVSGEIVTNQDMRSWGGAMTVDVGGIHFYGTVDEATARRAGQAAAEAALQRLSRERTVR